MRRIGLLFVGSLLATHLSAQAPLAPVSQKDAGTATLLSVILPGAGQFYAEEPAHGMAFLLGTAAAIGTGIAIGKKPIPPINLGDVIIPGDPGHVDSGPVIAGVVVGGAIWLWGVLDAGPAAISVLDAKPARARDDA